MDENSELRGRIAEILEEIGLNNDELARKLGVNKNTISAYRKGKGDLKGILLSNLSKKFGYSPDYLLMGIGPKRIGDKPTEKDTSQYRPIVHLFQRDYAVPHWMLAAAMLSADEAIAYSPDRPCTTADRINLVRSQLEGLIDGEKKWAAQHEGPKTQRPPAEYSEAAEKKPRYEPK